MLAHRHRSHYQPQHKPDGLLRIDRHHPLAAGLQNCIVPQPRDLGLIDIGIGLQGSLHGACAFVHGLDAAVHTPASTGTGLRWSGLASVLWMADPIDHDLSVRWRGRWDGGESQGAVWQIRRGDSSRIALMRRGSNNDLQVRIYYDGGNVSRTGGSGSTASGRWTDIVCVYTHGSGIVMYVDGAVAPSGTTQNLTSFGGVGIGLGIRPDLSRSGTDSTHEAFMTWDRALTPDEVMALYHDPWQMLEPVQRRVWVPVSAAAPEFPVALLTRPRPTTLLRM